LSVQSHTGTASDRVAIAQFTLLDVKRVISAAAIDNDALAAEQNEANALPKAARQAVVRWSVARMSAAQSGFFISPNIVPGLRCAPSGYVVAPSRSCRSTACHWRARSGRS